MKWLALRLVLAALLLTCCGCAAFGFFDDESFAEEQGDDGLLVPNPNHDQGTGGND